MMLWKKKENTEEDSKEEVKEENVESEIELIKHVDVNHGRRNDTKVEYTNEDIEQNARDKSQARRVKTNESLRRRTDGKGLANYARRRVL